MTGGSPRILVFRGGALGDFVVTLPVFQALRTRWPDAYIEVVGYPHIAVLAEIAGWVDKVTSLDRADVARLFVFSAELAADQCAYFRSFDIILSYLYDPGETVRENLERVGVRRFLSGSPQVSGCHAGEHLFRALAGLAIYADEMPLPSLPLDEGRRTAGRRRLAFCGARPVMLHPGSGSRSKNWPLPGYLALAREIRSAGMGSPFVLLGEADAAIADELAGLGDPLPVLRDCRLEEVAEALLACEAYVGNDSGITHMAAAVGRPVVAMFGPSDPALWAPRGKQVRVLSSTERSTAGLAAIAAATVRAALAEFVVGDPGGAR